MTISVHVDVPRHGECTAEVTVVERRDGQCQTTWSDTLNAGESRFYHPHDGASLFVAEGKAGVAADTHAGLLSLFAFALGQPVSLAGSDERGTIIGRAEYAESARNYLIRYRAGDGRLTENWWSEAAISAAPTSPPSDLTTSERQPDGASTAKSSQA